MSAIEFETEVPAPRFRGDMRIIRLGHLCFWVEINPRLGRWMWCKYCHRSVLPRVGKDGTVVCCDECGQGIDTLHKRIEHTIALELEPLVMDWNEPPNG